MNRKRLIILILITVALIAGATYSFFVDPSEASWAPKCMVKALTGYDCPGCGSQRMFHALLHGDIAAAWRHNAFLLLALPVIILMVIVEANRRRWPRLYRVLFSTSAILTWTLLLAAWTLLRNLL